MISTPEAVLDRRGSCSPTSCCSATRSDQPAATRLTRLEALAPSTRLVMLVRDRPGATPVIADGMVATGVPPPTLRAAILAAVGREVPAPAPPAHTRVPGAAGIARGDPGATVRRRRDHYSPYRPGERAPARHRPRRARGRPRRARRDRAPLGAAPSRTVVVFSGKGGVGKSVIATNLATLLAVRRARVALVDLDLQFGDVGLLLHLEAHPVTIDVLARRDPLDAAAVDDALATSAHGVRALLAPTSPESSDPSPSPAWRPSSASCPRRTTTSSSIARPTSRSASSRRSRPPTRSSSSARSGPPP